MGDSEVVADADIDLAKYTDSISSSSSEKHPADFQDSWLDALVKQPDAASEKRSRDLALQLAASEGVQLFSIAEPDGAEAAARHFHQHGFSVVIDAITGDVLRAMQLMSAKLVRCAVQQHAGGNRGHRRYTLHRTTMVRECLQLADSEAVCSVLERIWDSDSFSVQCTGGDFSLPAASDQKLHADIGSRHRIADYFAFHDPTHTDRGLFDLPAPVVKVYFAMVDMDDKCGPPLFVPGSNWLYTREDVPEHEPGGSKRAFCPKGSAIIMDMRVWHRGTSNDSEVARPMLSVHYAGPWYNESILKCPSTYWQYHRGALTREVLRSMRPRLRSLCKNLGPETCVLCGEEAMVGDDQSCFYKGKWYCDHCWSEWASSDVFCKRHKSM